MKSLYSRKQTYEIITALEGRGELPMKFAYFGEGAENWKAVQKVLKNPGVKGLLYHQSQLISKKAGSMLESLEGSSLKYNIFDLGCGDGTPILPVLDLFLRKAGKSSLRYAPMDLSESMLKVATKEVKSKFAIGVKPYIRDFESGNFSDITFELRRGGRTNFLALLGNTLGNMPDMHRTLTNFRESMTQDDYLLIGVELVNEHLVDSIMKEYQREEMYNLFFGTLDYYGVKQSAGEFSVGFNKRLSRIEVFFTPSKNITFKIGYERIHLQNTVSILIWSSTKYTGPLLTDILAYSGFRVDIYTTTKENNFALALAQPARTKET